jgi:hypothetical protein
MLWMILEPSRFVNAYAYIVKIPELGLEEEHK